MLYADSDMLVVNMVRIVTLKSLGLSHCHLGIKIRILSVTLPMPWPDRIPAKIHDW